MKHLRVSILFMTFVSTLLVGAQETNHVLWSFNYGYKGMDPELKDTWPIRQDVGSHYDVRSNPSVDLTSDLNYFGISPEFSFYDQKLSISPGVRFTNINSNVIKRDHDRGGYFFLRVKSDELVTEYARVRSIREGINYLGVPLEIKYTPFRFVNIAFYVKLSGELAYQLNSETNIEFKQKEMEVYHDVVLRDLDLDVNPLFGAVYGSVGARIKLSKKLFCSMDVFFPAYNMTKNNSRLVNLNSISGVQLSLDLPL